MLRQVSPEAEAIFDFILALHAHRGGDWAAVQRDAGIPDAELAAFLDYAAQFLGNLGNYKSFGDSKFVPRAQAATLEALARLSPRTQELYARFRASIFGDTSNHAKAMLLGYPDQGHVSTYYPDGQTTTKDEITAVGDFLAAKGLLPENTRLRKTEQGFEALVASAVAEPSEAERDVKDGTEWTLADGELAGKTVKLVFGDHGTEMKTIAECIAEAKKHAANETEARMLDAYAQSFRTGSLEAFKESQRLWIQDKGPQVETDIGFIEASPAPLRNARLTLPTDVPRPARHPRRVGGLRGHGQQGPHPRLCPPRPGCAHAHSHAAVGPRIRERQVPQPGLYVPRGAHVCGQRVRCHAGTVLSTLNTSPPQDPGGN